MIFVERFRDLSHPNRGRCLHVELNPTEEET